MHGPTMKTNAHKFNSNTVRHGTLFVYDGMPLTGGWNAIGKKPVFYCILIT